LTVLFITFIALRVRFIFTPGTSTFDRLFIVIGVDGFGKFCYGRMQCVGWLQSQCIWSLLVSSFEACAQSVIERKCLQGSSLNCCKSVSYGKTRRRCWASSLL